MVATPYKAVTWGDEPIYKDKLKQMTNNEQWLFENSPVVNYNTYGIKRNAGLKIMAGIAVVPTSKTSSSTVTVNFGTFFSSGCKPVITTGIQPTGARSRIHVSIKGISGYYPDHRGMIVMAGMDDLSAKNNVMTARVYVHFIAIGW